MAGRPVTIPENGRAKAYRPLPEATRRAAFAAALEAYGRGDFFLAHELLEPAWMGAREPAERALHSGLIKVAAGFVHAVRGNGVGVVKNLEGARSRLDAGREAGPDFDVDVAAILAQVEASLNAARRGDVPPPVAIVRLESSVP